MPTLFISHSSSDNEAVAGLRNRLRERGFDSLYVDFDAHNGIPAGTNWERELLHKLRLSDAALFVGSRSSAASEWCLVELAFAHAARKPIFPVALERGVRLTSLQSWQWVDLADAHGFERLVRTLTKRFDPATTVSWDHTRAPYPGLAPFEAADEGVFFARDDVVTTLLGRLDPAFGRRRAFALVGASGSGKSSVVRAGLATRLARDRERWVVVPPLAPGEHPLAELALRLSAAGHEVDGESLARDDRAFSGAVRALATGADGHRRSVLLIVDQAEELLVLSEPREAARFLALLRGATAGPGALWVVSTLRAEDLEPALANEALRALVGEPLAISALDRSRLPEVILGPAGRAGIEYAAGLPERIVEDTRGGDALPLLAYTLRALHDDLPSGVHEVTHADYDAVGGVLGALERRANLVMQARPEQDVLSALLRMVKLGPEGVPTVRPARREAFGERERPVVDDFIDQRLLVTSTQGATTLVKPAHDALLRVWTPLRDVIKASRERLQALGDVHRAAEEWRAQGRSRAYLLREDRLARARRHADGIDPGDREFLDASEQEETDVLEAAKRRARRLRRLNATLAVLALVAAGAAVYAFDRTNAANSRQREAERQERSARSRSLAAQALAEYDSRVDRALLLALEGYRTDPTPDARNAVITTLERAAPRRAILPKSSVISEGAVTEEPVVIAGPGGDSVLSTPDDDSTPRDGALRLWDVRSRTFKTLDGYSMPAEEVLSTAADRAIVLNRDRQYELWDLAAQRRIRGPLGESMYLSGFALSPDGTLIADRSWVDGELRLWDLEGPEPRARTLVRGRGLGPARNTSFTDDMNFSADGRWLVLATNDSRVRLWDLAAKPPRPYSLRPPQRLADLAFDPRRGTLVGAADDGRAWAWALADLKASPRRVRYFGRFEDVPGSARALSPDAERLAYTARDGAIVVVRRGGTGSLVRLEPSGDVKALTFSPDGRALVTSTARAIEVWDVDQPVLAERVGSGSAAAAVPDAQGRSLAVARQSGAIELWLLRGGRRRVLGSAPGTYDLVFRDTRTLLGVRPSDQENPFTNEQVSAWPLDTGEPAVLAELDFVGLHGGRVISHQDFGDADVHIVFWDTVARKELSRIRRDPDEDLVEISVAPDGELAAVAIPKVVTVVETHSGRTVARIPNDELFTSVTWSGDSTVLAIGTEGQVRFWDRDGGLRPRAAGDINRERFSITDLSLSPDGSTLASVGSVLRLYDTESGRELGDGLRLGVDQSEARFARAANVLVGVENGEVKVWDPVLWGDDEDVFTRHVCALVRRNLSRAEWAQAQPDVPYRRTCPGEPAGR